MAELLAACLAFPPERKSKKELTPKEYDTHIKAFIRELQRHESSAAWTKPINGKNILELLDPSTNSIPYAIALQKHVKAAGADQSQLETLYTLALDFCSRFDPVQMRYTGDLWSSHLSFVLTSMTQLRSEDLTPAVNALLRVDPSAGTFTSWHLQLVRACLTAGVPAQALPILDKNIYAYPQAPPRPQADEYLSDEQELSNSYINSRSSYSLKIEPVYVLEYYLLGATIYIALRNFKRARLFLESVLLSPTILHTTSVLQVEAYKKWLLLGLIAQGRTYPFPATADQVVMKNLRAVAKAYDALGDNFNKRDWRRFQADVDKGAALWQEDGNLRLVREAGEALQRYRVIDLQRTYTALPLSKVTALLEIPQDTLLPLLNDMVRQKHINASLSHAGDDTLLRFQSSTPESASASTTAKDDLEAQTQRITDLVAYINDADRRLQLTKEYVEYAKRAKRQGGSEDLADAMDLTYDAPFQDTGDAGEEDEDIMAS